MIVSTFAISYLIYSESGIVSAAESGNVCCEKTKNGAICQNTMESNCDNNFKISPTNCEDTDFCELGCCLSSRTGLCSQNTPKRSCEKENYIDNENCNVVECKKGCCVLGENAKWTNEKNCKIESDFIGIPIDFSKNIKSEVECIFSVEKDQKGACVSDSENGKTCKYITNGECNTRLKINNAINPSFYIGKFCSDPQLNTTCKAKNHKACISGKEDVYWFDSCENPESISLDCDIFKGSYCGKKESDYVCKDVNCYIEGEKRKNGESWCEYDEVIGKGKDLVGSRQIKHICYMGDEKIEPCADFRNEICVETATTINDGSDISQAACRVNNWRSCFAYDTLEDGKMSEKCNQNPDCYMKNVFVDTNFNFSLCIPEYPPGFEMKIDESKLAEEDYKSPAESICQIASLQCIVVKKCTIFGCRIAVNGNCLQKKFAEEMNDFCVNLGDCGAYINYNGDITDDGYVLSSDGNMPPRLETGDIITLKNKAGTKPALPGDMDFLGIDGNTIILTSEDVESNMTILEEQLQGVSGAMGSALLVKILSGSNVKDVSVKPTDIDIGKFTNGFATIQAGILVDYKLKTILGMPTSSVIAGGIGGILGALLGMAWGIYGALFAGLFFSLILYFLFYSWVRYIHVNFKCVPWQPPNEGNCEACNKDTNFPCTEYRCESLGYNCELANKGTNEELCVSKKINTSVPQIKPWSGAITKGYEYSSISLDGFSIINSTNKGCVDPFSRVVFGIETTNTDGSLQYTRCKIDMDASKPYSQMSDDFDEFHPGSALPYHKRSMTLPSIDALKNQYNLTEEQIKKLGELKFYIRCKNLKGTENPNPFELKFCVNPAPDLTAPLILRTNPINGAKIKYGIYEQNLDVYLNEPSECRWSKEEKYYNDMNNSFLCQTDLENRSIYGFVCNTKLTGIENYTKFYIKCQDKSENKNTMSESYVYEISSSTYPLVIKSMKPSNGEEITSGVLPVNIILRLETSGGAEDGNSVCEWNGNGYSDQFRETNSSFHSYEWKYAGSGNYNLNFYCEDFAGNNANATSSFTVIVDDYGPKIIRIYKSKGLKIITNEKSECKYSFDKKFNFENATLMEGKEYEHSAEWKPVIYYIQCADKYKNKGGIMQIKAYESG